MDPDSIKAWAAKNGLGGKSFGEIARDPKTRDLIGGYIDQLNAGTQPLGADQEVLDHRPGTVDRSRRPDTELGGRPITVIVAPSVSRYSATASRLNSSR